MGELDYTLSCLYRLNCRVLLNCIDHSSWTCSTRGNHSRLWYHTWRQVVPPRMLACAYAAKRSQMHNVGLMNAIWALSSRHLFLSSQHNEAPLYNSNDALPYYYKTLRYVQKAMQYNTYKTSLELLATSLIVSTYEMLDGSSQDWERHLHGVFLIQRSQVIHGDSMGLRQGVWWAWLCQDVWAAYRERRRPFTFWKPVRTFRDLEPSDLAARSVYLFAQVVGYCSRENMEDGAMEPLARISRAAELRGMLEDWKTYLTAEFEPLPQPRSTEDAFEPIWIHPTAFGKFISEPFEGGLHLMRRLAQLWLCNCTTLPTYSCCSISPCWAGPRYTRSNEGASGNALTRYAGSQ